MMRRTRERRGENNDEDAMTQQRELVAVIDDDDSIRESLPDLLRQFGYDAAAYASAEGFLASNALDQASALILDVGMPGMSGPELQCELSRRQASVPIVFITAQADEALRARLIDSGAAACLFKPFSEEALMRALALAIGAP